MPRRTEGMDALREIKERLQWIHMDVRDLLRTCGFDREVLNTTRDRLEEMMSYTNILETRLEELQTKAEKIDHTFYRLDIADIDDFMDEYIEEHDLEVYREDFLVIRKVVFERLKGKFNITDWPCWVREYVEDALDGLDIKAKYKKTPPGEDKPR